MLQARQNRAYCKQSSLTAATAYLNPKALSVYRVSGCSTEETEVTSQPLNMLQSYLSGIVSHCEASNGDRSACSIAVYLAGQERRRR